MKDIARSIQLPETQARQLEMIATIENTSARRIVLEMIQTMYKVMELPPELVEKDSKHSMIDKRTGEHDWHAIALKYRRQNYKKKDSI